MTLKKGGTIPGKSRHKPLLSCYRQPGNCASVQAQAAETPALNQELGREIAQNKPQSRKQTTSSTCVRPSGTLLGTFRNRNRLIPSPESLISPETGPESTLA